MKSPKILLVSHDVPPHAAVVPFILSRLFKHFPKGSYVVYTTYRGSESDSLMEKLPCKYYYAPAKAISSERSFWLSIKEWLEVLPVVVEGLKVIKKEKINSILVVPWKGNLLLSAYIMHKIAMIPLSVYFFDCYAPSQTRMIRKYLAKPIERLAVRSAANVFVMSEALREYYHLKYGINPTVVPHPVDMDEYQSKYDAGVIKVNKGQKKIIYTGMIYEAQYDSVMNLVEAIRGMPEVGFHKPLYILGFFHRHLPSLVRPKNRLRFVERHVV